jgi:5'-nucleotidase
MRILLTNDDGIHAPGLMALFKELSSDFDVHIVAPEVEMSAVGHAITLSSPLRVKEVRKNGTFFGYSITGTPADCVKIGVQELLETPPEMILSGINLGANVGVDVLYSGTVSAATEGAFLGIPSVALSLDTRINPNFQFAARFSREMIAYVRNHGLKVGTALNVNIPAVPPNQITGVIITRQGEGRYRERFERRVDPRGNIYYWLVGEIPEEDEGEDSDSKVLKEGKISITPVNYDLTCHEEMERLKAINPPHLNPM